MLEDAKCPYCGEVHTINLSTDSFMCNVCHNKILIVHAVKSKREKVTGYYGPIRVLGLRPDIVTEDDMDTDVPQPTDKPSDILVKPGTELHKEATGTPLRLPKCKGCGRMTQLRPDDSNYVICTKCGYTQLLMPRDAGREIEPRRCKVCNNTWSYYNCGYGQDEYARCSKCGRHTKKCNSIGEIFSEVDLDRVFPPYPSASPDPVKNPSHYCLNGYECSKVAEAIGLVENAYLFNIFKYIWRARHKGNEKQDLEKIIQYAEMRLAQLEKENEQTNKP